MLSRLSLIFLALVWFPLLPGCPDGGGGGDRDLVVHGEVAAGALVITEILAEPQTQRPEFIEILNTTAEAVSLQGCKITDAGAGAHEYGIGADVSVEPGERAVLASGPDLVPDDPARVDVVWEDIVLAQNDDTELVGISCPDGAGSRRLIDEVALAWSALGLEQGRSWQLKAGVETAEGNDLPENWCPAPYQADAVYYDASPPELDDDADFGTPGGATICEDPGTAPQPGEVVISEILVDEFDGLAEWFELHNPGGTALDVRRCRMVDIADGSTGDPQTHVFDVEVGLTGLQPGDFLLLAKGDPVVADGSLAPDYPYTSLGFNNTDEQILALECPDPANAGSWLEIDGIEYDWEDYGSAFEGRSLSLSADTLSAAANDDGANWCLAQDGDVFWESEDEEGEPLYARGTPGDANPSCPVADPMPQPGAVVFTEIMVRSTSGVGTNEEWFEVKNVGATRVGLAGCTLRNVNDDASIDEEVISDPLGGPSIDPGDYAVFVKSSAADTLACGIPYSYQYGASIGFNNEDPESLSLVCPGDEGEELIDAFAFDGSGVAFLSGIPWQLASAFETAAGNDDPSHWCSNAETSGYTWSCTVEAETNYGTPGVASSCP